MMIAGKLTLMDSSARHELLPECRARNVGILSAAPFSTGLIAGGDRFNYGKVGNARQPAEILGEIAAGHGVSLKACALQYALRFEEVVSVVVGMQLPEHVTENSANIQAEIPESIWPEFDAVNFQL